MFHARVHTFIILFLFANAAYAETSERIPVIFDTDIGEDIDDVWALALILASPELDLRMVSVSQGNTPLKARLVAKFLEQIERDDISIAIGEKMSDRVTPQLNWARDHDLGSYPGKVYPNAAQAMAEIVTAAESPVTILSAAPKTNLAALLQLAPEAAQTARVVAMSGSIRRGYGVNFSPDAEYNVRAGLSAAQAVYQAEWPLAIAPLDVAGRARLIGPEYQDMIRRRNALIDAVYRNYRVWTEDKPRYDVQTGSTRLFDAVAVSLAIHDSFLRVEEMQLRVDYKGYTVRDPRGRTVRVAIAWDDIVAFENWMMKRLLAWGDHLNH